MSVEALKAYGKKCIEDEELRKKAKAVGVENIPGQVELAKSHGFDFTPEDLQSLAKEVGVEGELSEDELESVAGGFVTALAAAVVGASAGVVSAGAAVASTTAGSGW